MVGLAHLLAANPYPISVQKGLILTEARIEGQQVLVILDSGAPGLVLHEKYFQTDDSSPVICTGVNGSFECKSRTVDHWEWLGTTHRKTDALVSDLTFLEKALHKKIHALIGLSVVEDYYVTIDYDQNMISLSRETGDLPKSAFSRFQYVQHLPVIACDVDGEKKILGLDTGAEANYLFGYRPDAEVDLRANASPVMVVGTDNTHDMKYQLSMDVSLQDGSSIPSSFVVDLDDEGHFRHSAFDGILGQAFLSNFNIIIHPGKQRICLLPRAGSILANAGS